MNPHTAPLPEQRPFADRPGYAAVYREWDLHDNDPDAWYERYGRYREPRRWLRYLALPALGAVWALFGFAWLLADGDPTNAMLLVWALPPLASPVLAVVWWLHDRRRIDPEGHERRLRALGWGLTAIWVARRF